MCEPSESPSERTVDSVSRCNRIDPWGDLHADPARGLFTGNRGPLVDDERRIVRHHASSTLWITCVLRFRDWRHPLDQPHIWTPLFFLDDAVALAAGHRPCAVCRRPDYHAYRDAVSGDGRRLKAMEIDRRLASERLRRGRGFSRAKDRPLWRAELDTLPAGTVVVDEARHPFLVGREVRQPFTFAGWAAPLPLPSGEVDVLTPPMSVVALRNGFTPTLHPSAVR
jgi:hypothetical protein